MSHDTEQELRELYRSHAQYVDTPAFTDALGGRLMKATKRRKLRKYGRIATISVSALVIAAGLGIGALTAVRHLSGPSPILAIQDVEPSTQGASVEPSTQGASSVHAHDLADAVVKRFPRLSVIAWTEAPVGAAGESFQITMTFQVGEGSAGDTVSVYYLPPGAPSPVATVTSMAGPSDPSTPVSDGSPVSEWSRAAQGGSATATTLPATADSSPGKSTVKRLTLTGGREASLRDYPREGTSYPQEGTTQLIVMLPDGGELTVTANVDQSAKRGEQFTDDQLVELAELLLGMLH